MRKSSLLILLATILLVLGGCVSDYKSDYRMALAAGVPNNWQVERVDVLVPETLSVSEENRFAPDGDIVWREEPLGDRRVQVGRILEEGISKGAQDLRGWRPVIVKAKLLRFHALSKRARKYLNFSGVHRISFLIEVEDVETGQKMSHRDVIDADLAAYVGEKALRADRLGITQRRRIVDHIARVSAGWFSQIDDPRESFVRIGL